MMYIGLWRRRGRSHHGHTCQLHLEHHDQQQQEEEPPQPSLCRRRLHFHHHHSTSRSPSPSAFLALPLLGFVAMMVSTTRNVVVVSGFALRTTRISSVQSPPTWTSSASDPPSYSSAAANNDKNNFLNLKRRSNTSQRPMSLQDLFSDNESKNDLNGAGVQVFRCEDPYDEAWVSSNNNRDKKDDPLQMILMDDDRNRNSKSKITLLEPILYEQDESQLSRVLETLLKWTPVTIPVVAFWLYDPTAQLFSRMLASLTPQSQNWVAVDGGAYQAKIITPAINGIVVQAIAILFAVLIGNTIDNLRNRQKDICDCIQVEAAQLRILISLLDAMGEGSTTTTTAAAPTNNNDDGTGSSRVLSVEMQQSCRQYLLQYTSRLIAEGHENTNIEALSGGSTVVGSSTSGGSGSSSSNWDGGGPALYGGYGSSNDSELNGILAQLNRAAVTSTTMTSGTQFIMSQTYDTTRRLLETRSKRLTALASTFPPLHYIIISALAISICIAFLMETDQDILVFLNSIQLRLLWTSLVGTFCALGVVLYDLGHPFRGSYQVSKAVNQLYAIRLNLKRSWKETEERRARNKITTNKPIVNGTTTTNGSDDDKEVALSAAAGKITNGNATTSTGAT